MSENTSNADEPVWTLTRGHLEEIAGRALTDEEVARFAKAFEHSSIGDTISGVTDACNLRADEEEDEDYDDGSLAKEDARNAWQH